MRNLYLTLTFLLLTACSTQTYNKSLAGLYRTKGGFEWGSSITINEDSTFKYSWHIGGVLGNTTGKWKTYENWLILNSDLKPQIDTTPDYYVIEAKSTNSEKIKITLYWPDSTPLPGATGIMYQNGGTINSQSSDLNGQMMFNKHHYDSLIIQFIALKTIKIQDNANDLFRIVTTDDLNDSYEYFINEKWRIVKDGLKDKTRNKNYYEKRFFKINNNVL